MDRRKSQPAIVLAARIALGMASLGGCAHGPAVTPMDPNAFVPPAARNRDEPAMTTNQPVAPLTDDNAPVMPTLSPITRADVPPMVGLPNIEPIPRLNSNPAESGETHADSSKNDAASATVAPAVGAPDVARPASERIEPSSVPSAGSGVYMCVGGVVARVGSTPIYTEKLLGVLDKEFKARSRDMSPEEFKEFVRYEIMQELHELTRDEILFATADKALSQEEHKLATAYAEKDRQERVRAHNGSVEVARHEAKEDGTDLDEQCRNDFRHIIVELYQQKQILPMIQVSADDMRDFYRQNVDKLYSEKERISFSVIEIKPSMMGGDSPEAMALDKIRGIREKAVRGDNFGQLASTENDDAYLKSIAGNVGWMDRNSFHIAAVDQAVWKLNAGDVTEIINDRGNYYIAKVDQKKPGHVRPFDEQAVQDDIDKRLRDQQMSIQVARLEREAKIEQIVSTSDAQIDVAVDLVMQKYAKR
jgi:hypothetical protein